MPTSTTAARDRFIDATVRMGQRSTRSRARIKAHFDAGASHVCIQPINPNGVFGDLHWQALEELKGAAG